jgi:heat shock protein HslJ
LPDERTVEVFTGCNEGSGRVSLGEGALTIRSLVLTQIGCGGPAGALERDVLATLTAPRIELRVEGSVLSLRAGERGLDWRA